MRGSHLLIPKADFPKEPLILANPGSKLLRGNKNENNVGVSFLGNSPKWWFSCWLALEAPNKGSLKNRQTHIVLA